MTDLTPEMGSTASCPHCGYQVDIRAGDDQEMRCPKCGESLPGGWRDHAKADLTNDELLRSFAVHGYDTGVLVEEPASLRCENCGQVNEAGAWTVDDMRLSSNMTTPGASESAIAALHCPNCDNMGVVELLLRGPDASPDDRVHAALLDNWGRSER